MRRKTKTKKQPKLWHIAAGLTVIIGTATLYWYFSLKAPKLPNPPLKTLAADHNINLGVRVEVKRLNTRLYPEIASSQFAMAIIDGSAHFDNIQPSQNKFDFTESDKIVSFAEDHGMPVQLHHLVWMDDYVLPEWFTKGNFSKEQLLDIVRNHITTIVKHYEGRVKEYTVVNEAFTEAQHIYGVRSWLADQIGYDTKYIDDYFKWAHQADPQAKLLLNDFHNETKNSVSDAMYNYLKDAKARGVPIDGIGMQLHVDASRPPKKQDVIDNMKRFGAIGVPVYVTEFDVNTNAVKGSASSKSQLDAQISYDMVRACIESKACVSFTAFGVASKNDFIKKITRANSRAYMFDSRYRPQPAFYSFRQAWQGP